MNVYLDISTSQMDSIREMCAYNFPAIVSIFGTPGVSSFKLDKILDNLCNDSVLEVRARIAACFHEISRVFGNESYQILKPAFMKLLNDKESDVSSLIFKNISKVLEYFSLDETSKKIESQLELITILVKREKEVHISSGYSWRLHLEYLDQFTSFELYFEPDQLHDHFTGLLIKHFSDVFLFNLA